MTNTSEALSQGVQHHQAGRLQDAELIYRQILEVDPDHADATHLLGVIATQVGRHDIAVETIGRAIQLKPDAPAYHNNLGNAYSDLGKPAEAVACYKRALQLSPDYADAYNNLGTALKDQGHLDEAIRNYLRALELQPAFAEAQTNLGAAYKSRGRLDQAVASYRQALMLKPNYAVAHNNLGNALKDQGKFDEAFTCYRRALELDPSFAEAHCNLATMLGREGHLTEAVECYKRSLELMPGSVETHNHLGNVLKDQGLLDDAIASYQRALELKPGFAEAHSNILCTLQYLSDVTPAELKAATIEFDERHAAPLKPATSHQNDRNPDRRLRIGFVSPDLGRHPVGYFLILLLENLDSAQLEAVCYSNRTNKDDMTGRFQVCCPVWRDVSGLSDTELAEKIVADRIDILFDLAGHTARNRALVFARKPAPIQIAWIGFEGTTGLKAMDYLLADQYTIPVGDESNYRERILRMPNGYVCYDSPGLFPEVTALPASVNGYVRFVSFNNPAKITREVVETWSKILHLVPDSKLMVKYRGMIDPSVSGRFGEMFESFGIDRSRLEFLPHSPHADYFATYGQVDIGLDPFPFGGGITTCDALWMGVPVVTCPLQTFASRHGLSHIVNAGLDGTVAADLDEYVQIAVSLANDLPRLAQIRSGLRPRMATSPLCDGKRFAKDFAHVVRNVWKEWASSQVPQSPVEPGSSNLESFAVAWNGPVSSQKIQQLKRVLNVGGYSKDIALPQIYQNWDHVLLDIDPKGKPDIVCDARELTTLPAGEFDAVYCSHNLEHYFRHDVPKVLAGFLHVLNDDGFAHIRVPDLGQLMKTVVERGMDIDDFLYQSSSGPITVLDVLYGFGLEIERSGSDFFAHKTGFTEKSLIEAIKRARFGITFTGCGNLEIVAYAFKKWPTDEASAQLNLPKVDRPAHLR